MPTAAWLNAAWMWKCRGELRAFQHATQRVEAAQQDVLREILQTAADSQFGQKHRFARLHTTGDFQSAVPLSSYNDYRESINRIAAGEPRVLTGQGVTLLEPTSGTSGTEKLIPYTPLLRRQFQRGLAAWIADLYSGRPAVRAGRAYWSISPVLGPPRFSTGGIPIGFDDDAAYLGRIETWALRKLLVMPRVATQLQNVDTFRYCTLLRLLAADDLSLISIWSPTFLAALFSDIDAWLDQLCDDLKSGTLSSPTRLPDAIARQFSCGGTRGRRRAKKLRQVFNSAGTLAEKLAHVWPKLALISTWADAAAAAALPELRQLFPRVEIQAKGLLATEGFVSLPMLGAMGSALAVRSHFFEFQAVDASGLLDCEPPLLAHQLDKGRKYRLVLTTGGGLYRYQLQDEVEVVEFLHACPIIRFVGKPDQVSDLVGEKLSEPFVRKVLDDVFARCHLLARFAMLAPVTSMLPRRYRLFVQSMEAGDKIYTQDELARQLEAGLCDNPHYRYAVALGQLAPVEIQWLDQRAESAAVVYQRQCIARGQKAGDIKPAALDRHTDWADLFAPLTTEHRPSCADRPVARQPCPAANQ